MLTLSRGSPCGVPSVTAMTSTGFCKNGVKIRQRQPSASMGAALYARGVGLPWLAGRRAGGGSSAPLRSRAG